MTHEACMLGGDDWGEGFGTGTEAQCTRNQDDGNVQTIRQRKGDRVKQTMPV